MHLLQILLPLLDNHKQLLDRKLFENVTEELSATFGGLTAYLRSPAEGLWQQGEHAMKDDIVVYEVMVDDLDLEWWQNYKQHLEQQFHQHEIVIRSLSMRLL